MATGFMHEYNGLLIGRTLRAGVLLYRPVHTCVRAQWTPVNDTETHAQVVAECTATHQLGDLHTTLTT